jgi:hypothetical protein
MQNYSSSLAYFASSSGQSKYGFDIAWNTDLLVREHVMPILSTSMVFSLMSVLGCTLVSPGGALKAANGNPYFFARMSPLAIGTFMSNNFFRASLGPS